MRRQPRPTPIVRALAGLLALTVLAASCAGDADPGATPGAAPGESSGGDPSETAAPDDPATVHEDPDPASTEPDETDARRPESEQVPALLDFTAPSLDGGQVVGAELAGQAVALWFWAPW